MTEQIERPSVAEGEYCFFISPIGSPGEPERDRSDEIQTLIDESLLPFGLATRRADQIGAPGMISKQVVKSILGARIVFADLTGANANVYYELGVAHSFGCPVVTMIDKARDLKFDIAHDRALLIGDEGRLTYAQSRTLSSLLHVAVKSLVESKDVPEVGAFGPLDTITKASRSDPDGEGLVAELRSGVLEVVEDVRRLIEKSTPNTKYSDTTLVRSFVEHLLEEYPQDTLRTRNMLLDGRTSQAHDSWVERILSAP